jgi:hypothetical protein
VIELDRTTERSVREKRMMRRKRRKRRRRLFDVR